jgi:hypothetical protein
LDSSFLRLLSRIFILLQAISARCYDTFWRLPGFLGKYVKYHNRVLIDPIQDTPRAVRVIDSQLIAARSNAWHRPGLRHRKGLAALQPPQQVSRFESRCLRHRRGFDLSVKPSERLVIWTHTK